MKSMKNMAFRCCGFTLVELLAALISIVLVLGAATGFLITALERQKAVLAATRMEAEDSGLAMTISNAIKTADDFQIFADAAALERGSDNDSYGSGVPSGNVLSCRYQLSQNTAESEDRVIEESFEFAPGPANTGGTLTRTTRSLESGVVTIKRYGNMKATGSTFFSMKNGLLQAHWSLFTALDRVDFNVYGVPLNLR